MVAYIFTNANNHDTVNINLGDTFVIKLRDQPGEHLYSKDEPVAETVWEMQAEEGLRLLRDEFIPDVPGTKTVPGIHEWEYEAVKPGTWDVEGTYDIIRFGGEEKFKLTIKVI
jgi:predicted secreted protein